MINYLHPDILEEHFTLGKREFSDFSAVRFQKHLDRLNQTINFIPDKIKTGIITKKKIHILFSILRKSDPIWY